MKTGLSTPRQLRRPKSMPRKGKNRHSTGREKIYVTKYNFLGKVNYGTNPMYSPRRKKLKGWQKENMRRAA